MKVILFSGPEHKINIQIFTIIEGLMNKKAIESHNTIQSLSQRLKIDTSDIGIILLSISDKGTLDDLLLIRHLLIGHRIIAILPDQENDTLSKAHSLYPRFISYKDNNFEDLKAVMEKMFSYLEIHSKQKNIKKADGSKHKPAYRALVH